MVTKQVAIIITTLGLGLGLIACTAVTTPTVTPASKTTIPAPFTTYTDEQSLFSISYPQDWEPALSLITELEDSIKNLFKSIESDLPLENATIIFLAGLSTEAGYDPNVNIVVESLDVSSLDEAVELEIQGIKSLSEDFKTFTQTKVVVGGREAVIVDHEYTFPGLARTRPVQMYVLQGKVVWIITCTTSPENFLDVKETCNQIVRSFQILQ